MTAHGNPATRYRRAIETRSVFLAELAAQEMGHLPLVDALGLLQLYAAGESEKYERAAVRWLGRLAFERRGLPLRDVQWPRQRCKPSRSGSSRPSVC